MRPGKTTTSWPGATPTKAAAPAGVSPFHRALIDLCFERGFGQLTALDLSRRAGLSTAEFRSRYLDLEDCFHDVYRTELLRYRRSTIGVRAGLPDWRSRLRSTAYAFYRYFGEDERLCRFALVEARHAGERSALLLDAEIKALSDLIDEGRSEPGAPPALTPTTAVSLAGGIFNQIYLAAGHGGPLPPESEFVPGVMYAAVMPYLGAHAAGEELRIPPPPRPPSAAPR